MGSGSEYVTVNGMGTDSIGNVYIAGQDFPSTVVIKLSPTGATTWSKTVVSSRYAIPNELAVKADGNVYVAGFYLGVTDFEPSNKFYNKSTYMYSAAYVLNLISNGQFGWATTFNNPLSAPGTSIASSIAIDSSGSVIVGGSNCRTVDFDPGKKVKNLIIGGGVYLAKLTKAGALVWASEFVKQSESVYSNTVNDLEVDASGVIYAVGKFSGSIDFAPGPATSIKTPLGKSDVFVVKLTSTGNYIWDETFVRTKPKPCPQFGLGELSHKGLINRFRTKPN
jgi:sugar lactone lactonase YvrE